MKKKWILVLNFLLIIFVGCSSNATKVEVLPTSGLDEEIEVNIDVKKFELDNGLKVLIYENHKLPIYSYYTFFDVGGRYESPELIGGTHYLEHMMFKGAKKYGPGVMDTLIEGNGGSNNAYTSRDLTVYHEHLPTGTIDKIIDLEADRMQNLLVEQKSFEVERKVILDERLRNYESNPRNWLFLSMMKEVFEKTPYGRSVIGTNENINALTRDNIAKYFKKNYAPNNAVVVVAGDVNAEEVMKLINEKYGPIPPSKELADYKKKYDDDRLYVHRGRYKRDVKLNGINPYPIYLLAYKGEPLGTRKGFAMDILSSVLGDGESSYLNQKFVVGRKPSLVYVGVGNYTLRKSGVFYIAAQLLPKKNLGRHKRSMLKALKKFCNNSNFDFERAVKKIKNQYLVHTINKLKTNRGVAHFLGLREIVYDDYEYYKKELEIYESIKADEVKKVCNEVFSKDEYIFLSVWNKHPKKKVRR